jgi:predicted PurR-regulated permease PerM
MNPPALPADSTETTELIGRPRSSAAETVLATAAVIAVLWWGQRFLIPVVAGMLLSMLLAPLVLRAERFVRSRALAAVLSLTLVIGVFAIASTAFSGQLLRVTERVPEMMSLAAIKLGETDPRTQSLMIRAREALHELDSAATGLSDMKIGTRAAKKRALAQKTAAVQEENAPFTDGAAEALRSTAVSGSGMLFRFASEMTIVFFVAFFMLAGGSLLSDRFLDLWGHSAAAHRRAQQALRECARQVRIYAGVLLVTNAIIGLLVWAAFAASGLPDAGGWGVTAAVLHLVPYLGMALLTGLGAAETFLAHGTIASALGMGAFIVLLSTLVGTIVTAWLQSLAAKMNPAAVFIGLVFWGAMWGIWGLFLGPVLVVLLKVIAEHTRSAHRIARLMQG